MVSPNWSSSWVFSRRFLQPPERMVREYVIFTDPVSNSVLYIGNSVQSTTIRIPRKESGMAIDILIQSESYELSIRTNKNDEVRTEAVT